MQSRNVVLVDGVRSPFGRGGRGRLVATRLDDAGAQVLRALLDRSPKVKDNMIEDVGLGNVSGQGEFVGLGNVARLAGLPMEVCSFNSNRQCGSSMETFHRVAMSIAVGATDVGVADRSRRVSADSTRSSSS
jgi:acetyl-CoA acyltransferase